MSYLAARYEQSLRECFGRWGEILQHPAQAQWSINSLKGPELSLQARVDEDWLQIRADTGAAAENGRIRSVLQWNGRLDGAAKYALNREGRSISICAELPLDDEVSIVSDLDETLAGFGRAASLVKDASGRKPHRKASPRVESARDGVSQESVSPLQQLLTEAGWPFAERSEGSCMVELDSRGDFYQALIETEADGSRRASVELADWESPAPASKDALAVLLLAAAGVIRMVRPVVDDFGDRMTARFEIRFTPGASPALVDRGLSSLSVACRFCGREAAVLNNLRIAEKYIAVRNSTIE
jgi:hypothetical protein